ncbi:MULTISPECIES: beta strand repeat-containing protein [unclassified Variovorax]|uniref:beta strand repeat-containing protein n=1 Tax=unclassified Variovorax TaxID=663243 RepID=UPI003ED138B4
MKVRNSSDGVDDAPHSLSLRPLAVALLYLGLTPTVAQTLPTGFSAIAGGLSVAQPNAATMNIHQSTARGIAQWSTFSIGAGATVNVVQPGVSSVLLNRVVGNELSTIAGSLRANGQVFLVNPNGVLFSKGSSVTVGGLVASTLDISNANFMAGKQLVFERMDANQATVVNAGSITASEGGTVALVGAQVRNEGSIDVARGSIGLLSGRKVTMDFDGDGLTTFRVAADALGSAASVENAATGQLTADGGRVVMVADAASIGARVVNQQGTVRARSLSQRNGEIVLGGGSANDVHVTGVLDATGPSAGQRGGGIDIAAQRVLLDGATLDASGAAGGGDIKIHATDMGAVVGASVLRSDATQEGDGGRIVAFGDVGLRAWGQFSARGAGASGAGGFIETSGGALDLANVSIDAGAASGIAGRWLIDPFDIVVLHTPDGGPPASELEFPFSAPGPLQSAVYDSTINTALQGASVTIDTGKQAAGTATDGQISFFDNVAINYTGTEARTLTFNAARDITSSPAAPPQIQALNGPLSVNLNAGVGSGLGGSILFYGSIDTKGGNVSINAPAATAAFNSKVAATTTTGANLTGGNVATHGGNVSIVGQARAREFDPGVVVGVAAFVVDPNPPAGTRFGVELNNYSIDAGSGNISVRGQGLAAEGAFPTGEPTTGGVILRNGAQLVTASGNIEVSGSTNAVNAQSGLIITVAAVEGPESGISTGSGNVTLRALAPATVDAIDIGGSVSSKSGMINLRAGSVTTGGGTSDANAQAITLGGAGNGFVVDAIEFDLLSAPVVSVGAGAFSGFTGNIALAGQVNLPDRVTLETQGGSIFLGAPVVAGSLALLAGGSITQTAAITADSVMASSANGSVRLLNANNQVGTLAGFASKGAFEFLNTGALTVGTVPFQSAAGTPAFGIGVQAVDVGLASSGNLTIANNVFAAESLGLLSAGSIAIGADIGGADVRLAGVNGIAQSSGGIGATSLVAIAPGGDVSLTSAENKVGTLAGRAAGRFDFLDADGLIVGNIPVVPPPPQDELPVFGTFPPAPTLASALQQVIGANGVTANAARVRSVNGDLTIASGIAAGQGALLQAGGAGSLVLHAGVQAKDMALLAGGSVLQSGPGAVAATQLFASGQGGNVTLLNAGNLVDTIAGSAGNGFDYAQAGALKIGNFAGTDALQPVTGSGISGPNVRVETQGADLTVEAPVIATGNAILQTLGAGNLQLAGALSANNLVLGAAGSITQIVGVGGAPKPGTAQLQAPGDTSPLTASSLLAVSSTGDVSLVNPNNRVGTIAGSAPGRFDYADADALTVGTVTVSDRQQTLSATGITANTVRVRTFTEDLTLAAGVTSTEADLIAGARFQNPARAGAPGSGTWRIWADTWVGENRGGLVGSGPFPNYYNCSYGGPCGVTVLPGNHFIYVRQPTLTVAIGSATRRAAFPNPTVGFRIVDGLILGDTGIGITGAVDPLPNTSSLSGTYNVGGRFASAEGYAIDVVPGRFVVEDFPLFKLPDVVRDTPTTWLYDRNIGRAPICLATGPLEGDRAQQGADVLAREWSRVRSRPNLTSCVDMEKRNGCADF